MRLLLDTNIVIRLVEHGYLGESGMSEPEIWEQALTAGEPIVSVVSIWEADIKHRSGRLELAVPVSEWHQALSRLKVPVLALSVEQILEPLLQEPMHRDPFDRLLLCIASAEGARLVTLDRALQTHSLAWHPSSSLE